MSNPADHYTARLLLRPVQVTDLPALFAIQSDPEAMQFTHVAASPEACWQRLCAYEASRAQWGFAPWVVVHRQSSQIVGWGGLSVDPLDPGWGPEVSYFFDPACWGQGLATELVATSLELAFGALKLSRVSAFAMPGNAAFIRVLQKCGFAFLRYEPGLERNRYQAACVERATATVDLEIR